MQEDQFPLIDAIEMDIVMHRDAHFGANFYIMLDYYHQEGVGVMPDFAIEKIEALQKMEAELGKNIAEIYLPEAAKKRVLQAKELYQRLREVYREEPVNELSILLSDLILAEEEVPQKEMEALLSRGEEAVPLLIDLLQADSFYDPLFPGYGRSPIFAARTLGEMGDERALIPLFSALGQENFFTDEEMIKSICRFGSRAIDFLLVRLTQRPLSRENEYAAIVLNAFPEQESIARASLSMLEKEETLKKESLASYLVFNCPGLQKPDEKQRFVSIAQSGKVSKELQLEMAMVIKNWKSSLTQKMAT